MGSERWWTRVCAKDDVPFLEGRRVEVDGFYVGMFNTEEGFCAVHDVCPHRGGPLSAGTSPPRRSPVRCTRAR